MSRSNERPLHFFLVGQTYDARVAKRDLGREWQDHTSARSRMADVLEVECPAWAAAADSLHIELEGGATFMITVPPDTAAGETFEVRLGPGTDAGRRIVRIVPPPSQTARHLTVMCPPGKGAGNLITVQVALRTRRTKACAAPALARCLDPYVPVISHHGLLVLGPRWIWMDPTVYSQTPAQARSDHCLLILVPRSVSRAGSPRLQPDNGAVALCVAVPDGASPGSSFLVLLPKRWRCRLQHSTHNRMIRRSSPAQHSTARPVAQGTSPRCGRLT